MRARWLLVPLAVVTLVAGCSSGSDDKEGSGTRSTTTTTEASTTTSSSTTTTVPFDGATDPVELPSAAAHTALLTDVRVEHRPGVDTVTFAFKADVPGVRVEYVTHPTEDGSGAPVQVDGSATLQVRLSPASGADLTGETPVTTYTGPARVEGNGGSVHEVVRSGDFEGVLSWVIGVDPKVEFRVSKTAGAVVVELESP
jgi:hypothetical protein